MKKMMIPGIILLWFCLRCTNKPTSVGSDYNDRLDDNTVTYHLLTTVSADTFYQTMVNTGNSLNFYIGDGPDTRCHTFMRFEARSDTGRIDSANVSMYVSRWIKKPAAPVLVRVHEILATWNEYDLRWDTWEKLEAGFIGQEITSFQIAPGQDTVQFSLPPDLVEAWIDSLSPNNGIFMTTENTDAMIEFFSSNATADTTPPPIFTIHLDQGGSPRTYRSVAEDDLFLITRNLQPRADRIYIHNSVGFRTFFRFDLDTIPKYATINRALLRLFPDTTLSYPNNQDAFLFSAFPVSEKSWKAPSIPYEVLLGLGGAAKGDSCSINITYLVQNWSNGVFNNYGLVLIGTEEINTITGRAFYSSSALESHLRPVIEIHYTLPPTSRLE